jgi:hypothetical protein
MPQDVPGSWPLPAPSSNETRLVMSEYEVILAELIAVLRPTL